MKVIGLIGGTTWHSTIDYYRTINQMTNEKLGDSNSAKILLYSVNFEEFKPPADITKWGAITDGLIKIAKNLENAGAACILLCANTPHLFADIVQEKINVPLIHIAEATALKIKALHIDKVALLGTKITMEQNFFRDKLSLQQIETIIPTEAEREFINTSVFDELGKGIFDAKTKQKYLEIINRLIEQGAKGIILGCTEIPLLIQPEDVTVPVFDTTKIHSEAAVEFSLS